jgi:hypothetical protein
MAHGPSGVTEGITEGARAVSTDFVILPSSSSTQRLLKLRYFSPPESFITRQCAYDSSARRLRTDASVYATESSRADCKQCARLAMRTTIRRVACAVHRDICRF